ncbi:MAG: NADH-ubiquinone oxidoreductase-F iron-sulfur binding region domain-containing protein [Verrucomicrobiota bacterium]
MNKLNKPDLDARAGAQGVEEGEWIRVGCDTGGIAAGAGRVFQVLCEEIQRRNLPIRVKKVGSVGYSFADPLVELQINGMPRIVYGAVDEETARRIVEEHVIHKKLIDGHVLATRQRGSAIEGDVTHILIKDTSSKGDDKSNLIQTVLMERLKKKGLEEKIQVVKALDMGVYDKGVVMQMLPSAVTYTHVLTQDVTRIKIRSILAKQAVEDLLYKEKDKQVRIVLRNCGAVDPENLEDALNFRAYQGLKKVLFEMSPERVIEEMQASGLRGRGGAGFPTWMKWKITREARGDQKYVICNADEGDPGAFMDRSVLEGDPHAVLEGMIIAAYAMGASMGYFYIRAEYPLAIERVQKAINDAREAGLLGQNILGSSFSFDAKVRLGAGAFVCGEETALIASIEGKRGSPSPRPPFPSIKGLWGKPTAINNVETLANIPAILDRTGGWYNQYGIDKSRGTKVFAVTGKVKNAQLVEVPMGVTLREIVFDICGGVLDDKDIKAVQTGGPSGGVVPEELLDTPVSYEHLTALGSIMGSGGMLIMDQNDCMVDVAKFYLKFCVDESCGKCAPCRVGGYQTLQILDKIARGRGDEKDLDQIKKICRGMQRASLCALGQTAPNPVLSTMKYFSHEYQAYIEGGASYARKMAKALAGEPAAPATATATA